MGKGEISSMDGAMIMNHLEEQDLDKLRRMFSTFNSGHGMPLQNFVESIGSTLLKRLQVSEKKDERLSDPIKLAAMLIELFYQIDVNGNGLIDWGEFEDHCIRPVSIESSGRRSGGIHELSFFDTSLQKDA